MPRYAGRGDRGAVRASGRASFTIRDLAARGYEAADRQGIRSRWPSAATSVGIALADSQTFASAAAFAQAAALMKVVAKRQIAQRVALDRRRSRAEDAPEPSSPGS